MRLQKRLIEIIAFNIVNQLKEKELMDVVKLEQVVEAIEKVIIDELFIEDKLDEEVRQILAKHMGEIQKENADYHEVFRKIKMKLVKDRNLLL